MGEEAQLGSAGRALFYHGGDLGAARARFPNAPLPWIDLSTGINPVSYPIAELPSEDWTRLPAPGELLALQHDAAKAYGAPNLACVVAAPGTQALLQWLPRLFPAETVAVLGFTYAEHARCWAASGARVETVGSLDDVGDAGTVVVVNPNNPDGRMCSRAELLDVARRRRGRGLLVVDEAFMDVMPEGDSLAPDVADVPGLVVLRSFGKTYGLPGARLGFALAAPDLAASLRQALGPWAVAGPTLTLGRRALQDRAWLAATRQRLLEDGERLRRLLGDGGLRVVGGTPLYLLAEHPHAHALFERLGELGVLTRAFETRPEWLRFGLPEPDRWGLLEERFPAL